MPCPKAALPLLMSWTALLPACGNDRWLSRRKSHHGKSCDDRVRHREVGVSGPRDRCDWRGGRAAEAGPRPRPDVLRALPRCQIGMEACNTSHYWARELIALGHDVR